MTRLLSSFSCFLNELTIILFCMLLRLSSFLVLPAGPLYLNLFLFGWLQLSRPCPMSWQCIPSWNVLLTIVVTLVLSSPCRHTRLPAVPLANLVPLPPPPCHICPSSSPLPHLLFSTLVFTLVPLPPRLHPRPPSFSMPHSSSCLLSTLAILLIRLVEFSPSKSSQKLGGSILSLTNNWSVPRNRRPSATRKTFVIKILH